MGDSKVFHNVACHHAVATHKPKEPGEHLVGACPVVGVDQDNLEGFGGVDGPGLTQPDHVLCKLGLAGDSALGLRDHEGEEVFLAESVENRDRGDIRVFEAAAFVGLGGKDRRGNPDDLIVG